MDQEYGHRHEDTIRFSETELVYLSQQQLGRVATSSADGQPHVVPIVYEFDGKYAYFSGWNLRKSLKFKNILSNPRVAIVVDDLETVSPWRPRGIELRGRAEILTERGSYCIRMTIESKRSWGLH